MPETETSVLNRRYKRLYIITGKGGVGKTSVALAMTKRLNELGVKAKYLNFTTSNLSESISDIQEILTAKKLGIPYSAFSLLESSQEYVSQKMKSKTIGRFVVKTPFFKALVSMIPGFNYLIYLGKTLEALKKDEDLVYVLDSPSSGHALTMFEATKNFGEIFRSGLLFEDTQKMINYLRSENFAQINILSLPTTMAANEAMELEKDLERIGEVEAKIFCNNSLKAVEGIDDIELPPFLRSKLKTEEEVSQSAKERIKGFIKHSLNNNEESIVEDLSREADGLF